MIAGRPIPVIGTAPLPGPARLAAGRALGRLIAQVD